jgi:hypothetical protein
MIPMQKRTIGAISAGGSDQPESGLGGDLKEEAGLDLSAALPLAGTAGAESR